MESPIVFALLLWYVLWWGHTPRVQTVEDAMQHVSWVGVFEQSLAQASLRRVEAKEFVFAEGDPTTHLFRVETGAIA